MSVALLHLVQVCFCLPRHVDVLQRDRERRLTWNMQLSASVQRDSGQGIFYLSAHMILMSQVKKGSEGQQSSACHL